MVMLEALFIPFLVWLTVFCWRAVPAWRITAADISWSSKLEQLSAHVLLVFVDIICFAGLAFSCCSLYRLRPAVKVQIERRCADLCCCLKLCIPLFVLNNVRMPYARKRVGLGNCVSVLDDLGGSRN